MAISLYEIKGTDPFSGSRIMINDNFTIIEDEINLFENYFNLSSGVIQNLTKVTTTELLVGTNKLNVTTSVIELNNSLISLIGDVSVSGNILTENINDTTINDVNYPTLEYTIGSITEEPEYYIYKVSNSSITDFTVYLHAGLQGQSILFIYENNSIGTETNVVIMNATTSTGDLYIGTNTKIKLADIGYTVELKFIEDGWYITNGYGYTLE